MPISRGFSCEHLDPPTPGVSNFSLLLDHNEPFGHFLPKYVKLFVIWPAQHVNHVLCELKRHGLFHLDALAWRNTQQKSEVDVNQVALNVDHDVTVVPVFDLQNVADKRVRGQTVAKVIPSLFVPLRSAAILLRKVVLERGVRFLDLLFKCVYAHGIIDSLDKAAVGTSGQNLIRLDPERQLLLGPNLAHLRNELHRKLLLPHIVICLNNESKKPPRGEVLKGRVGFDPIRHLQGSFLEHVRV